jgi:hypothetical protein
MQLSQSNLLEVMMVLVGITYATFPCHSDKSYGACGVKEKKEGKTTMISKSYLHPDFVGKFNSFFFFVATVVSASSSSQGSFTCAQIKVNHEYSKVAACCVPTAMDKLVCLMKNFIFILYNWGSPRS